MFRTFYLLVGGLALLWTASSQAQDAVLGQLYGKGVHAYFSCDYVKAYERLNAVISAGSRDPRAYYFRGLAYLNLGRTPEAEMDFGKGAELESKDINKFYDVGRALERVQGSKRQLLESYRVQARMAAFEESERLRKVRYEAIKREEARVLRQQVDEAAAEAKEPAETIPAPAGEATAAEPAADTETNPSGVSAEEMKPAEDPFATKASEEEKPAAEQKPAAVEEKPADQTKPVGKKSIFSALGKSLTKGLTSSGKATVPSEKP